MTDESPLIAGKLHGVNQQPNTLWVEVQRLTAYHGVGLK